jgi:hypothetical protein
MSDNIGGATHHDLVVPDPAMSRPVHNGHDRMNRRKGLPA